VYRVSRSAPKLLRHAQAWLFLLALSYAHAETLTGKVVRVADGDTLTVLVNRQQVRVRLLEIDAPESKQPFGKRSRQSLADLCAGRPARVVWSQLDRYGRTLGRVWCDGVDANAEQVRRGMAWVFDRYATDRSLYPMQDTARAAHIGLWSDAHPIPPWQWRDARRRKANVF
jgi:endonuclease YncB( thermonuclease family)